MSEYRLVRVCRAGDLWEGDMMAFKVDDYEVLVVKVAGDIRAYFGLCPHALGRLAEGYVDEEGNVVCGAHEWIFDGRTGMGINPKSSCLPSFEVEMQEDEIYVRLPTLPAKQWVVTNLRYNSE